MGVPLSEIESMFKPYVKKLVKNYDMKAQATDSGMAIRPLTAAEVLKHLDDFGIDSQLAHGKIRQMSGGQRQRLGRRAHQGAQGLQGRRRHRLRERVLRRRHL